MSQIALIGVSDCKNMPPFGHLSLAGDVPLGELDTLFMEEERGEPRSRVGDRV